MEKWIPVAEGLPDKEIDSSGNQINYLVTHENLPETTVLYYSQEKRMFWEENEDGHHTYYAVSAWMNMPEPYIKPNPEKEKFLKDIRIIIPSKDSN